MSKQLSPEQIKRIREWMASDRKVHKHGLPRKVTSPYVLGEYYTNDKRIINPALYGPNGETIYYVTNIITKTVQDDCRTKTRSVEDRLIYLGLPLIMKGFTIVGIDDAALTECSLPPLIDIKPRKLSR